MAIETSVDTSAAAAAPRGEGFAAPKSSDADPLAARYERDGYLAPFRVLGTGEAGGYWERMQVLRRERPEDAATAFSFNPHYLLPWLYDLARHPKILDKVERVLGPDILVWSSGFFNKMPHDPGYVSWHQDSTYWGLEPPDIVSAWVAFTPSRRANGCMRVVPGTHALGQIAHVDSFADSNMLSRGQEVQVDVDEADAVDLELEPGEMSLHHVRIVHGSNPNPTDVPRVGYVVRYIATSCRQIGGRVPAALVRGEDRYGHFDPLPCPAAEFDESAWDIYNTAKPILRSILFREAAQGPREPS